MKCFGSNCVVLIKLYFHKLSSYKFFLGLGIAMAYQTAAILSSYYFEKKRGLVNGIISSGSGAGLMAFPPLTVFLIKHFQIGVTFYNISKLELHSKDSYVSWL